METKIKGWLVREDNGLLQLVVSQKDTDVTPEKIHVRRYNMRYWDTKGFGIRIDESLFPEVKWEDSSPKEVEIIIRT